MTSRETQLIDRLGKCLQLRATVVPELCDERKLVVFLYHEMLDPRFAITWTFSRLEIRCARDVKIMADHVAGEALKRFAAHVDKKRELAVAN